VAPATAPIKNETGQGEKDDCRPSQRRSFLGIRRHDRRYWDKLACAAVLDQHHAVTFILDPKRTRDVVYRVKHFTA
jgi:hypothetical protein